MKKFWKITRYTLLSLLLLIVFLWLAIQTSVVQNWLAGQVTSRLSKDLNTTIRIKEVRFGLFNRMLLKGTLIQDRKKDTLLYAGLAEIRITDWFFFKDRVELKYIALKDAQINFQRTDSIWNYQFLVDYFSGPKKKNSKRSIDYNFKIIDLENVAFVTKDAWLGENQIIRIGSLKMDPEDVDLNKKIAHINSLTVVKPQFFLYKYKGNRPPRGPRPDDPQIVNDPTRLRWNTGNWDVLVKELNIEDGIFKNDRETTRAAYPYLDGDHLMFSGISGSFQNLRWARDTITANVSLKSKERSGFEVKTLKAKLKMHPELMEFANLDIRTNRSQLKDYFALKYESFDDFGSFLTKVAMEGNFKGSEINSEDIAFFAPGAKTWDKIIRLDGSVKGTVDNLSGKNIRLSAGNNTYINGDVSMSGLPDINATYIDFKANDFKTTYTDAIKLIPSMRNVTMPRLSELEYIRFRGTFNGFIRDFVTFGTIETNLGTIVSDVNMKLPGSNPIYSGSIRTTQFKLGRFLDNVELGNLSFNGKIKGSGFALNNLNATLDGTVAEIGFKGYNYTDIKINGSFTKKLFNGKVVSNDPNLTANLEGIIDLNSSIPRFDFNATVEKANLKNLKLYNQNIDFNGKFHLDFTGTNIDNFVGTARVYDASVYKDSKRFSFDSLVLESRIVDNNKTLTILSNEFDVAIAGEFSIRELPASFQTFLNRYYPTYIKPSRIKPQNENFSFVVTTKNVEDYINLVDPSLKGFNNSTVSGRINTRENLLDLNAEVPQFNYNNFAFFNTKLKGIGSLDSLVIESNIEDIFINDSLHFPQTNLRIVSANDISKVRVQTSANTTLNSADIAARVQTIPDGVRILFDPSKFEVNGKKWEIEENGELVLSKSMVSADGVKIFSGDQSILVTTVPSEIGNTNDLKVNLTKINIGDFTPFVVPGYRLEGLFTGEVEVIDPFGKMELTMKGEAEQFRLDDDSIGLLKVNGSYSKRTGRIDLGASSDNKNFVFDVNGFLSPADSLGTRNIDLTSNLKNMSISPLKKYLSTIFSDMDGFVTGDLRITGPANRLKYLGKLQLNEGKLKVNYTQVAYTIPSTIVNLQDGFIDFGAFTIRDDLNNTATVSRAKLYHTGFRDMSYDFAIDTRRLLLLNTTIKDNSQFYGKVIGNASFRLNGHQSNMEMDISGEPVDTSYIYLPPSSSRESAESDFIVWKVYGREMTPVRASNETNLNVRLDINANNYATVYVVMDELSQDVIEANGHGNLEIRAGTNQDFTMIGRYDIDRGSYNFTFQSLLKKPFKLTEGAGNYIQWTGSPYDATIDIEARYEAENVRFSDLNLTEAGYSLSSENVRRYRGVVYVYADLTGRLMKPDIRFRIDLPSGNPLRNDQEAQFVLQRIQNDENELNKQVSFLLVFSSFGPLSNTSTGNLVPQIYKSIVVNSISGFISNQVSKQLSKAFEKSGIKVNFNAQLYSGTDFLADNTNAYLIDRSNLTLTFAKSVLNERLTFTFGSALDFGLSSQQVQAKSFQFLPDLTAEWKIRPDGRLVLTMFYRDSYNYIYSGKENRSGISISHRREFDSLNELFRRKKKQKLLAPAVDTTGTGSH